MAVGLRAKAKGSQTSEFLRYAANSWSSHLTLAQIDDDLVDVLYKFLSGHWVLTWIQILATCDQLDVLIQASKHVSKFSAKQKVMDVGPHEESKHIMKQDPLKSWAEDFAKLVGKFGTILRRNPESIYKLIPPFYPHNSAIYQQFKKTKGTNLIISGLSDEDWDDSIARLSFGFGTYASSVLAARAQIAILISLGSPRPLAMLFTHNNTTLLVGSNDRRTRSLSLHQPSPSWQVVAELEEPELDGHLLNASNHMALSQDGDLVAVAYRGHPLSAWETDGPVHIGHCWRKRD